MTWAGVREVRERTPRVAARRRSMVKCFLSFLSKPASHGQEGQEHSTPARRPCRPARRPPRCQGAFHVHASMWGLACLSEPDTCACMLLSEHWHRVLSHHTPQMAKEIRTKIAMKTKILVVGEHQQMVEFCSGQCSRGSLPLPALHTWLAFDTQISHLYAAHASQARRLWMH